MPDKDDASLNKTEHAAALRASRRAAREAKALRENLARRKAQSRARATQPPSPDAERKGEPIQKLNQAVQGTPAKCR